jgi:hypothetical protein
MTIAPAPRAVLLAAFAACLAFATPRAQGELVIQKEGTTQYHRPGCPVIRDGAGVLALTRAQAEARGLSAHAECDPANAPTPKAGPPRGRGVPPPDAVVHAAGGKYYHRQSCRRLRAAKAASRTLKLAEAAKTHWPCPTCRPPILKKSAEPAVPGTGRRRGA